MEKNIKKFIFGSILSLSVCVVGVNAFAQTKDEYLNDFLDNVYTVMLERESDPEGKEYWKNKILSEEIGILDFLNQILDQDEFEKLQDSSEDFITKNYTLLVNRAPDEEGFNYWLGRIGQDRNKDEKLNLINEMAYSQEFMGKVNELGILFKKVIVEPRPPVENKPEELIELDIFIKDAYQHLLGRESDLDGFNYWKGQLTSKNQGALDLINNFIALDEFKVRNLNDTQFISIIYEVLFNREADSEGLNYWNSIYQKDKSSNRMKNIVLEIADDTEFLTRIKNMGIILKKIDLNLFYSELLTSKNDVRVITSSQLSEIKKGMSFFDIIVKLGRTRNVSNVEGVNIAKYIVDKKEFYFIFSDPSATYQYDPMEVLKS